MEINGLMERVLPLKGVYNFRDMGGIKTRDGRKVKRGLLFRSADLTDSTEQDKKHIQDLNLKVIYDYRDKAEADVRPDPQIGSERHERIAVNGEDKTTAREEWDPATFYKTFTREKFAQVYREMPVHNKSYHRLMQLFKNPEENLPVLHHCAGGRDRTGVGAMLLLRTLGVSFETIMDDYLLSNQTLTRYHEETFADAARYVSGPQLKRFEEGFLVHEEYLDAAIGAIFSSYGKFGKYLETEFGITRADRRRLQAYCLE
ncbi:tyrosine-protein phosphatase [Sporolactobacillus terrae]|uniref:Protein-tyrosine-phosphatase n=1 Tax=Sporolactobacillus terrae TaxID=269673 RepID=A0ABX5Q4E4_9BACL|nr:tyrosine-protein phosphatase [Sporolactobacillus terrae]QAA21502.1 protein-tyrosine-phosphatase [Sporolactobacillus terrae]QAA24474.1 protein-tyrosine-phosphatase [Sporolactobacillus terrae]UAK16301.1 tyrosine-protein phosphatase [Sporolactobacillus terrae]